MPAATQNGAFVAAVAENEAAVVVLHEHHQRRCAVSVAAPCNRLVQLAESAGEDADERLLRQQLDAPVARRFLPLLPLSLVVIALARLLLLVCAFGRAVLVLSSSIG